MKEGFQYIEYTSRAGRLVIEFPYEDDYKIEHDLHVSLRESRPTRNRGDSLPVGEATVPCLWVDRVMLDVHFGAPPSEQSP